MDINNFGIFNSNTWGNVSEWIIITVTIITIILLVKTFREQRRTNEIQASKNDLDLVLSLFERLQADLDGYMLVENDKNHYGTRALFKYAKGLDRYRTNEDAFAFFKLQLETDNIFYLIKSINVIDNLIHTSKIEAQKQVLLNNKLNLFFKVKLEFPLSLVVEKFLYIDDSLSIELRNFYNKHAEQKITIDTISAVKKYLQENYNE
ncbi:hypothetical protein GM921_07380 [Pedobacter sp. LMG 31464]|uniref:Uncharacterized protein n=1 Tax=Pedobacter planticolens TaxID=2679964 RepID=A0A923DYU9_9SPHI|nr:hypothetical protein [Pedobacter planticolens]MBB2145298.1 hypothetical protein [Pedobacter planticolens]